MKENFTPEEEEIIAKNGILSNAYSTNILKKPFPKGENSIAKHPEHSFFYSAFMLKSRFPKSEDNIAKNPKYLDYYAKMHNLEYKEGKFHEKEKDENL